MKYCPNCGRAGVAGLKFCPQCGQTLAGLDLESKQGHVHEPEAPPKNGKMRKAAGILMILSIFPGSLWITLLHEQHIYGIPVFLVFMALALAGIGGAVALRRTHYNWALAGAICSIIFPFFGIPALILLVKRKGEFSSVERDTDSLTRGKSTANLEASNGKSSAEATEKECPHCGQTLRDAAFKCSRCKKWVPNELFNRLCDEDVKLIKNNNLTPHTPSLMTIMVIGLMQDSNLEKRVEKVLGGKLDGKQRFNLLVFESYCYFNAITLSAKTKRGCRDTIMGTLKDKLLNGIIESVGVEVSGTTHDESTLLLKAGGEVLYDQFDDILEDLGTDAPSQVRNTMALASAVYGDKQADIVNGLPLYGQLLTLSRYMTEAFGEVFLVEEEDFDWQAMMGKSASL